MVVMVVVVVVVRALTLRVGSCCCVVCNENHGGQVSQLAFPKKKAPNKVILVRVTICFQTQMYEDFSADHANKTITMETHPHLPGPPQVCASAFESSYINVLISIPSPFGCNLLTNQF